MTATTTENPKSVSCYAGMILDEVEKVILGKRETAKLVLSSILAGGHILLEDVPGVGKTTLAKTLATVLGCSFKRIQFTPDLLPSDITGTSIFNQKTYEFEFRPGPIFANFILADEINRATPKTQSSLLECMEEHQVTTDGLTHQLASPFFVIATENKVEHHGTYPLPEAQLDRFMMRISIGYPSPDEESRILDERGSVRYHPEAVLPADGLLTMQSTIQNIHIESSLKDYIVAIVSATRNHSLVALGASPRGSLSIAAAARALAAIDGREYVLPDDIKMLTVPVLAHRLIIKPEARIRGVYEADIIEEILSTIPVPSI